MILWNLQHIFGYSVIVLTFNPFAYTYGWEPVWATDVFAFSSSFLSADGMTCHISFIKLEIKAYFEWCIKISIVSIFGYKSICTA
jgi:hypothetical protein